MAEEKTAEQRFLDLLADNYAEFEREKGRNAAFRENLGRRMSRLESSRASKDGDGFDFNFRKVFMWALVIALVSVFVPIAWDYLKSKGVLHGNVSLSQARLSV